MELYCNGQWGTVCDDSFNQVEANTVCQQLGYTQAAKFNMVLHICMVYGFMNNTIRQLQAACMITN